MIAEFRPLDAGFNIAVRSIAARLYPTGYDVADDAPSSLEELNAHVAATGRMIVWSGGSERTIFDDAETNYAFRAWHDWHHLKGQHPFDAEGEAAVFVRQRDQLRELYGVRPAWEALLHAEIIGQLEYEAAHGCFPDDQRAFAQAYLDRKAH